MQQDDFTQFAYHEQIPGVKRGGAKLAIIFTCTAEVSDEATGGSTICNTRSAKVFTKQAYEHGVVLVRFSSITIFNCR